MKKQHNIVFLGVFSGSNVQQNTEDSRGETIEGTAIIATAQECHDDKQKLHIEQRKDGISNAFVGCAIF